MQRLTKSHTKSLNVCSCYVALPPHRSRVPGSILSLGYCLCGVLCFSLAYKGFLVSSYFLICYKMLLRVKECFKVCLCLSAIVPFISFSRPVFLGPVSTAHLCVLCACVCVCGGSIKVYSVYYYESLARLSEAALTYAVCLVITFTIHALCCWFNVSLSD